MEQKGKKHYESIIKVVLKIINLYYKKLFIVHVVSLCSHCE